ncbi:MAG: protein kinase, partial [Planctomycetota bacterium]|nr:protein kinase [Planctomycetota bacterium]
LHRDVKPSNLMLDESGKVWITDFGLCKEVGSDDLTHSGDILGTLRYMPPERLQGESDVQGDVYGLGITLYEMLTRTPAYAESDRVKLFAQIAKETPQRPRAVDPRIPADLEAIVLKAIDRDRHRRYATADALASDLRAYLEGEPIAARAPTFGYHLRTAIRRHKPLAVTIGVAAIALLATSVYYVLSLREKEEDTRFQNYVALIAAAEAGINSGNESAVRPLLEAAPPEHRNWEWHQLHARVEQSLRATRFDAPVYGLSYSPDGELFAASVGTTVRFQHDADGREHARIDCGAYTYYVRWSPTGERLVVATSAGLQVWSWPGRERIHTLPYAGGLRGFALSHDGRHAVTGGTHGRLRVWDVVEGRQVSEMQVNGHIMTVDVHPDGDRVVLGRRDGHIAVWDLRAEQRLWTQKASRFGLHSVCYVGGDRVAAATEHAHVHVYDAVDGNLVRTVSRKYQALANGVRASPDGRSLLVLAAHDVFVWDTDTWELRAHWPGSSPIQDLAFHPDGWRFGVASNWHTVIERPLGSTDLNVLRGHIDDVMALAYAPSGSFFVTGGVGGVVRLWDARTHEQARAWIGHRWSLYGLSVSHDSRYVAASDAMGDIVIWDVAQDEPIQRMKAHEKAAYAVEFLPQSMRAVSVGQDGRACLWDAASGERLARSAALEQPLICVAVHPRSGQLVTGDEAGVIRVHDAGSLEVLRELRGHDDAVYGVAFDATGRRLASVSSDQTLRLWDYAEGRVIRTARAQTQRIGDFGMLDVAFSRDGTRIATSARDSTVRLWDTATGRLVITLGGHDSWVYEVAFSPDGTQLLSVNGGAEVRVWDTRAASERLGWAAREASVRAQARLLLGDVRRELGEDPDAVIQGLRVREDLEPDLREAALRDAYRWRGGEDALVARLWRAAQSAELETLDLWIHRGLAAGMMRAAGHRNRQDSRRLTLWGALTCRLGDYDLALERLGRARLLNKERHPELFAVDLAFLAMAHAGLDQAQDAWQVLRELEALLKAQPDLRTARVTQFLGEARAAVTSSGAKNAPR